MVSCSVWIVRKKHFHPVQILNIFVIFGFWFFKMQCSQFLHAAANSGGSHIKLRQNVP